MQENNIPTTPNSNGIDQAQFEADKRAVYKHPLFSLLALLLEKCEQATQGYFPSSSSGSSTSSPNGTNSSNGDNNDSFSRDIQAFVQLLEKEKRPLLTNNAELDGLMIKALQVLRIHLLELEKVQELCRDFCTRYIACLRGKMQSENLLRSDYPLESNNNLSNSSSPINSPEQQEAVPGAPSTYFGNNEFLPRTDGADYNLSGFNLASNSQINENDYDNNSSNDISSNTSALQNSVLPVPHNPQTVPNSSLHSAPMTATSATTPATNLNAAGILGSTPLSQIGCPPLSLDQFSGQLSPCGSSDEADSEIDSNNDDLSSNFSNNSGSKRQKRGILPKQATSVMRAWLFQHLVHPYPTEDEKRAIAAQTNLTLLQVNNWFINARRRILQPMLEHTTDNGSNQARKKSSTSSGSSKRFWSESLTSPNTANASTIDPNIENISANINRADPERKRSKKVSDDLYSSDDSNDSLVIDRDC